MLARIYFLSLLLVWGVATPQVSAAPIVSWNFDNTPSNHPLATTPLAADTGIGTLSTTFPNTGVDFPGSVLRLKSDDNNGKSITFAFSTLGFQGLTLSMLTAKNQNGYDSNQVAYSADGGMTFMNFGSPYNPNENSGSLGTVNDLLSLNFSSITALDNNANVQIRITLNGATNNGGQNRFDNITFSGTVTDGGNNGGGGGPGGGNPIPEPASLAVLGALTACGALGYRFRRRPTVA